MHRETTTDRAQHPPPATRWQRDHRRPLPRPDEELVDQGSRFDVRTLLRRALLRVLGLGAVGAGLSACGDGSGPPSASSTGSGMSATTSTGTATAVSGEIPDETARPYPGDGSNGPDVLQESGIVRSDIRSSIGAGSVTAEGVPMTLELSLRNLADDGTPFAGVAVYVWHCDREGRYSMYSEGVQDENYLRGVQVADTAGVVRFTSVFPACYSGRWPHIHFEVYPDQGSITESSTAIATSQVALPKDACTAVYERDGYEASVRTLSQVSLTTDNVFGDDSGARQIATVTGDVRSGLTVRLTVGIDTSTSPSAGGAPPPGGGPTGGPSGPPSSG
jgi:protocatechuate 3,4-dioxygenase beta subunit